MKRFGRDRVRHEDCAGVCVDDVGDRGRLERWRPTDQIAVNVSRIVQ